MTKSEIRRQQKELRNGLSKEEQNRLNNQIQERLFSTKEYLNSKNLLTFVSLTGEVDTYNILTESFKRGKRVYVPRVEARKMEFYQITDLDHMVRSKFGILEPEGCEVKRFSYDINQYDASGLAYDLDNRYHNLMILPGLAFDRSGNRIGYGAGYYDKYLSSFPENTFYKIALAYEFQLMDIIPSEEYDRKADAIITPSEIHICKPPSLF